MIPEYLSKSSSVTNTNEDTAKILNVNNGSLSLFQKIAPARIMAAGNQLIARISTIKPNSPRFISEYKNATKDIMISARRMQIRFFRPDNFLGHTGNKERKTSNKEHQEKKNRDLQYDAGIHIVGHHGNRHFIIGLSKNDSKIAISEIFFSKPGHFCFPGVR